MASAKAKIRHVFGDTFSCRAAPPDILVKLSGTASSPGALWHTLNIVDARVKRPAPRPAAMLTQRLSLGTRLSSVADTLYLSSSNYDTRGNLLYL